MTPLLSGVFGSCTSFPDSSSLPLGRAFLTMSRPANASCSSCLCFLRAFFLCCLVKCDKSRAPKFSSLSARFAHSISSCHLTALSIRCSLAACPSQTSIKLGKEPVVTVWAGRSGGWPRYCQILSKSPSCDPCWLDLAAALHVACTGWSEFVLLESACWCACSPLLIEREWMRSKTGPKSQSSSPDLEIIRGHQGAM